MENSSIVRGRGSTRNIIGHIIKKDLYLNGISLDLIYLQKKTLDLTDNRTLWII